MVRFPQLPIPGPGDLLRAADRGYEAIEAAIALVPRIGRLVDQIERIAERADQLITDVDRTRRRADQVVTGTETVLDRADALVLSAGTLLDRAGGLLDQFEPSLTTLAPMAEQLARTTSPDELAALVQLVDTLPELVGRLQNEILPILSTLDNVGPDVRDLLDTTREFNEILGSLPGLGRIKKRVEERQEQQDAAVDRGA